MSQRHHDVERRQEENEVKETVAVCDPVCLIIDGALSGMFHVRITSLVTQYSCTTITTQ